MKSWLAGSILLQVCLFLCDESQCLVQCQFGMKSKSDIDKDVFGVRTM